MKYFLAPRSGEKSHKNYESTIRNGVPLRRIERFLDEEGKRKLATEDIIYAWGNREGTRSQWESMEYGDTVIFYAHRKLVMVGEVYYKLHSDQMALAMWPPDEKGHPWAYTFFLRNLRFISIPMQAFNVIAGYKPNFIVQGFSPITDKYLKSIEKEFGSVEKLLSDFGADQSEEMPLSNEAVYVNVDQELTPEIITAAKIMPRDIHETQQRKEARPYKTDYTERSRSNAITGSKGEELVLKHEVERLTKSGYKDLADKVNRVSVDDDSKGYDVLSFEKDGKERYIEVKTSTSKSNTIRFFMSQNEYSAARNLPNYFIYYVDGVNERTPRITTLKDPIKNNYFLVRTDTYIIEGTRQKE